MQPLELDGVWMWSSWQDDRAMAFNSYFIAREDGNIAVDPLPPSPATLAEMERLGGVRTIVLTNRDHRRDAAAFRERFGAQVIASAREAGLFDVPIDATVRDGEEVFPGAIAVAIEHGKTPGEIAIYLPRSETAIVGDAIIGSPAGSLSFLADEKIGDPVALALSLRRLWARRLRALLLCDGQPLFCGADDALATLLETHGGPAVNRINIDDAVLMADRDHAHYVSHNREIGLLIGARKLGYQVTELPPGATYCPLHAHAKEEEMFFVLSGEPTIRTTRGSLRARPGDVIAFPTGDRGAHHVLNETGAVCRLLLLGMHCHDEVAYYPDSNKLLIRDRKLMLRAEPNLDYFDGEE